MMDRRIFLRGLAGLSAVPVLNLKVSRAFAAQKPVIVPIFSSPFGAGPHTGNSIWGNIMAKAGETLIIAAQETPGYLYNYREMAKPKRWKTHVFGTDASIVQLGILGGQPDIKEFLPEPIPIKFKFLHGEGMWSQGKFFITTDPNTKTMADLKGKRISLGLRAQSNWGVFPRLLLKTALGITPENTDIRHLTPGAMTQQLIDGTTDVIVSGCGTDPDQTAFLVSGWLKKLDASGRKIRYIPMEPWALEKTNKKYGTSLVMMTFKAGTLPQQDQDLPVGMDRSYKAVHSDFPEEVAYDFVKAVYKYSPQMKDLHALWSILTPRMMIDGLTEDNTHPGAVRALKEVGLWDTDMRRNSIPVTYPEPA